MKRIPLMNDPEQYAFVDDEDYPYLSQFKWAKDAQGYARRTTVDRDGKSRLMHRVVCNTPKGMSTDHINRVRMDNRRENLRSCTHQENVWSNHKYNGNKQYLRGVCFCKQTGKWKAYITEGKSQTWLGRFEELRDAIAARDRAIEAHRGDFAVLNDITQSEIEEQDRIAFAEQRRIMQQRVVVGSNNHSGYRGVCWNKQRHGWRSYINVRDDNHVHQIHLGVFSDPEDAAYVYDQAAMQIHGRKARLNLLIE
jgi:hypothetical protein